MLAGLGVGKGDVVGLVKPASLETAVAYMAIFRLGAVALPMSSLFGPDALAFRLRHGGAKVVLTSAENAPKVREAVGEGGAVLVVIGAGALPGEHAYDEALAGASAEFEPVITDAEDPAFLIYTSGTTGDPKGALHAHRIVFGHIPAFEAIYEFYPQPGDVLWSPADWAWIAGLMDILIPAWWFGLPIVVDLDGAFSAERAVWLMREHKVTLTLLPPTALRVIRASGVAGGDFAMRAVLSGAEVVGAELLGWCEEFFGCTVNEGYGQTEMNACIGNCASVYPIKPGALGRALPGTVVAVVDDAGQPVVGQEGEIAVDRHHPNTLLEYWRNPEATKEKFVGDWLLTGDLGVLDEDGYVWFVSRKDDVIKSAGLPNRPGGDRRVPRQPRRGRHVGRDRRARRTTGTGAEGVRRAASGRRAEREPRRRAPRARPEAAGAARGAAGGGLHRRPPQDHDGEDHASGPARRLKRRRDTSGPPGEARDTRQRGTAMANARPDEGRQLRSLVTAEGLLVASITRVPVPEPAADEVVVRVEAAPINPSDINPLLAGADLATAHLTGTPEEPVLTATIPPGPLAALAGRVGQAVPIGLEGAGTVVDAGSSDAAQALIGQTVAMFGGSMHSEYRCIKASECLELPEGTTAAQGASCFVNPLTALGMTGTMRRDGHTALVHTAAASSLGQMLVRLCRRDDIPLVNIVRRPEQEAVLRDVGATHVCDSSRPSFLAELTEALRATSATVAFDAIGGGHLASQILTCMEDVATASSPYDRYGSTRFKQVYVYGMLDTGPVILNRRYGAAWSVGGWLLMPYLDSIGPEAAQALRRRVAGEVTTTFASSYARVISLEEALDPDVIAVYAKRATGEKFLIDPTSRRTTA